MSNSDQAGDERLRKMEAFIRAEHFRYRCFAADGPTANEYPLPARTGLGLEAPATPLLAQVVADFTAFCAQCLQVTLEPNIKPGTIRLRLTGAPGNTHDVLEPAAEAFTVTVSATGVLVEAAQERGLLHATHHLERLMADRGGPYLAYGRSYHKPVFTPRITTAMSFEMSDEYLSLLSHFGANGLLLHAEIGQCARSRIIPEFNHPDAGKHIAALNQKMAQLRRHGFDSYILLNSRPLTADHPVFLQNPARRGAPLRVFDDMACQYVLCSGNPEVLEFYDDVIENLFREMPDAAGAAVLIGGEGFMHCYSRPLGPFTGYSSCPHCAEREPSAPVAELVNRLATAVKRTGAHKPFFAWPYSAFTWSGGADRAQLRWMEGLSADVHVLSNFDTNSPDEHNGAGVYFYDYNIKSVGPSAVFRAQAAKAREMGRRIYTKTESNVTPSVFFPPYIPVHCRWHARFRAMAELGVAGYLNQWYFYGMSGSLPDELQYHAGWNPEAKTEDLLARAAIRDFNVDASTARQVVSAWQKLSAAWDDFPYSAMTNGEREFYMRGPLHYGPAHPLIFNVQNRYNLPASFFGLSGDLAALATPAEVEALLRDAKPRYVSELLLTLPYGIERYLELTGRCRQQWSAGLAELQQALGPAPAARARMELDVCELLDIHLTTLEHVVRFYAARDRLGRTPTDLPAFREILAELETILRAEIANAERSLPLLAREFRLRTYDIAMVQEKLRQCRYVLEQELPIFNVTVRFHVWNDYP